MIELQPNLNHTVVCKVCQALSVSIRQIQFQGIHTLADCLCEQCGFSFYQTLPIGHDFSFPIQFSKDGHQTFYDSRAEIWLAKPLIESVVRYPPQKTAVACQINTPFKDIVMINCLDSCFGHVFTKLWNIQTMLRNHPHLGVIVLIPLQCAWLVPTGVAEIWSVDLPLKKFKFWIEGLDDFVKAQFKRFEKVFLSNTFTHLDHQHIDISAFVKKQRFDLSKFSSKPICITFILREDRFWHNSILMAFLFKASIKLDLEFILKTFFVWRQNSLIKRTVHLMRREMPHAKFIVSGLGKSGNFDDSITDLRANRISGETEEAWNNAFSESHLVIGVHGSNMLIPSYLAAAVINIVPRYKMQHIAEDTCQAYTNRYLQFLGRHVDEFSSPNLVAKHAINIIRDFPYLYTNTEQQPE